MNSTFDVRKYGAVGDGDTLDTQALQSAIDACEQAGGGRVVLAAGTFLSGTLRLCSDLEIYIAANATLLGAPDKDLYSGPRESDGVHGGEPRWLHALLIGENLENITFSGEGTIDGNNVFDAQGEEKMRGPHTILLRRCENVTLRGLNLTQAANYAFLFYACQKVRIEEMTFEGGWDGVHFRNIGDDWNRDLQISNCQFMTGDDAIAGACVENALIENCFINSSCNGVRLIGPARNWTLRNCRFEGPGIFPHRLSNRFNMLAAINVQPGAWGPWPGPLEKLHFHDIEMERVQCAFHLVVRKGNTGQNIILERIRATTQGPGEAASSIECWNDEPLHDVTVRDISIVVSGGGAAALCELPIEKPGNGTRALPVWGLYVRNVRNFATERVELETRQPDARAAERVDDAENLQREDVTIQTPES